MKLRHLKQLIEASPIILAVFAIFQPAILFIWAGGAMVLAALVVYPNEIQMAVMNTIAMLPMHLQQIGAALTNPPKGVLFLALALVFSVILAPVLVLAWMVYAGESWADLTEDWEAEL